MYLFLVYETFYIHTLKKYVSILEHILHVLYLFSLWSLPSQVFCITACACTFFLGLHSFIFIDVP